MTTGYNLVNPKKINKARIHITQILEADVSASDDSREYLQSVSDNLKIGQPINVMVLGYAKYVAMMQHDADRLPLLEPIYFIDRDGFPLECYMFGEFEGKTYSYIMAVYPEIYYPLILLKRDNTQFYSPMPENNQDLQDISLVGNLLKRLSNASAEVRRKTIAEAGYVIGSQDYIITMTVDKQEIVE